MRKILIVFIFICTLCLVSCDGQSLINNKKVKDYITSYENSNYTKPNPMYFQVLLDKFNLKPEEVILFGNNEYEDAWCAYQLGIKTYLINEYLMESDKLLEKAPIINLTLLTASSLPGIT